MSDAFKAIVAYVDNAVVIRNNVFLQKDTFNKEEVTALEKLQWIVFSALIHGKDNLWENHVRELRVQCENMSIDPEPLIANIEKGLE